MLRVVRPAARLLNLRLALTSNVALPRICARFFAAARSKSVEEIYQKKTQREHILLRPETYIGPVQRATADCWVHDVESKKIVRKEISYTPALYKIFDEILVNAADNRHRGHNMSSIRVVIDADANLISIYNDGAAIPVVMHDKEKMFVPELIFGHLLTSSNYDDSEQRFTGGRHGFGAKLTNIFSTEFTVEIADAKSGKQFKQVFQNNMKDTAAPVIAALPTGSGSWTKITFRPDLPKFGLKILDAHTLALMRRRVFDVAACCCDANITVTLNGDAIPIKRFDDYIQMHDLGFPVSQALDAAAAENNQPPASRFVTSTNSQWTIAVRAIPADSDSEAVQVSFVNSIATLRGGTHVAYISDQIARYVSHYISKKHKDLQLSVPQIKSRLVLFISGQVQNPSFDSQTKETLTLPADHFADSIPLSDRFFHEIVDHSGIVESSIALGRAKQLTELSRALGGKTSKKRKLLGIPKLDDANSAGGPDSANCTLILTEGDSAKALAVAGLSVIGRDTFGVFPLRGKVLNVRDATHKQIVENVELTQLATILGLNPTMTYESDADMKTLRYGKLMLMTDQDHDGSHIKGLIINWLHFFWPKLLQRDGFLQEFITPIVKAKKSSGEMSFFSLQEFQNWRASLASAKSLVVPPSDGSTPLPLPSDFGWRVKYYKGLGTSTAVEGKQYFGELEQHKIAFRWSAEGADSDRIDLAFRRARADNRKAWLSAFVPGTHIDHSLRTMTYGDFIDKELIQFSMADNVRSIPSLVDGLKNGQRKVLFACLKRSLTRELKVAQLAGYVSEHTGYHHGEVSLHGTIVNLAQDFVGSNNLPLLVPAGQFGTRHAGGKDAASARYIFTHLAPLTRSLFRAEDDAVLTYRDDDGQPVEPVHYLPVIPLVLLNGVEGVGTGYSTSIPRFHPLHVLQNVRCALQQQPLQPLVPCTLGFQGEVLAKAGSDQHFISKGKAHKSSPSTIEITELPLEMWTNDYKVELESLIDSKHSDSFSIKSFTEHHTDKFVHFRVVVDENRAMPKSLTAALKLEVPISLSNMHLFDCQGRIKRYSSANDIITEFVPYRLQYYEKRRLHQLATFKQQQRLVGAKVEFVDLVCDGRLKLQQQSRADVEQQLIDRKLDPFPGAMPAEDIEATTETDSPGATKKASKSKPFDYLLQMPISSLTRERSAALRGELQQLNQDIQRLQRMTAQELWLQDLAELEDKLKAHCERVDHEASAFQTRIAVQPTTAKKIKSTSAKARKL